MLSGVETTDVYPLFWEFARRRMDIFIDRYLGLPGPWTTDPIFLKYRFTNVFRASDRVSQYLISHVIYDGNEQARTPESTVLRILLFKFFNSIATWEFIEQELGKVEYNIIKHPDLVAVLSLRYDSKKPLYNNAYMMQGKGIERFGYTNVRKFWNHCSAIFDAVDKRNLTADLLAAGSLRAVYERLTHEPYIGSFLAYQYAIDLNYSPVLNFDEDDFVQAGPGCLRGMRKCFAARISKDATDVLLRELVAQQEAEFARHHLRPVSLFGRRLHLIDIQNLFCEVDKYTRVALPDINHYGQKRIKNLYSINPAPVEYKFPPKWGITLEGVLS